MQKFAFFVVQPMHLFPLRNGHSFVLVGFFATATFALHCT